MQELGYYPTQALKSHLDDLQKWLLDHNRREDLGRLTLKAFTADDVWLELHVAIVVGFLSTAARTASSGGTLPYEYAQTCLKIVPVELPRQTNVQFPGYSVERFLIQGTVDDSDFDPSKHNLIAGQISALDDLVRCFVRIVPLLSQEKVISIAPYLARRNDNAALHFALRGHDLSCLKRVLITAIPKHDPDTLSALCTLLVHPEYLSALGYWTALDDLLWKNVVEQDLFNSPTHQSLAVIMTHKKLSHMLARAGPSLLVAEAEYLPRLQKLRTLY
ncbi:hypothetical protein DFH06DRAFT_1222402 [Mycena polygramma]|nr:hypothetical protein DFH06DRAFT_1222402 [Mycena polygramma]